MNLFLKSIGLLTTLVCLSYTTLFLIFQEQKPDFIRIGPLDDQSLCLSDIFTDFQNNDNWKSAIDIEIEYDFQIAKQFYGQKISINQGSYESELWIGVTSHATARYEYWEHGIMIEEKEIGFMKKITNRETLQLAITRTHFEKDSVEQEQYLMRLNENEGFFGDHALISVNLKIGEEADQKICLSNFSKDIKGNHVRATSFTNQKLWSKYESPD